MSDRQTFRRSLSVSAWIAYVVIVFEILYMISPFALYFYSLYAPPLIFLQAHQATAFLTQSVLPHFSHQDSFLVTALQAMSLPIAVLGLVLFLAAFAQIYGAKFRKAGPVSGGLYRVVRHPQYLALALMGLGCTIFWPRFIVCLVYATMLFLYYQLAKSEESRCRARFGDAYEGYVRRTGRFLPRFLEEKLPALPRLLPTRPPVRAAVLSVMFIMYIGAFLLGCFAVRSFAFSHLRAVYTDREAIVSIAPLAIDVTAEAAGIALNDTSVGRMLESRRSGKLLIYVVPREWSIPELGVQGAGTDGNMLVHPTAHGNPSEFGGDSLTVFIVVPVLSSPASSGKEILEKCLRWEPVLEAHVSMRERKVTQILPRTEGGEWKQVPVPIV